MRETPYMFIDRKTSNIDRGMTVKVVLNRKIMGFGNQLLFAFPTPPLKQIG
jgi:hypothetical protein